MSKYSNRTTINNLVRSHLQNNAAVTILTGLNYCTGKLDWTTGLDYYIKIICIFRQFPKFILFNVGICICYPYSDYKLNMSFRESKEDALFILFIASIWCNHIKVYSSYYWLLWQCMGSVWHCVRVLSTCLMMLLWSCWYYSTLVDSRKMSCNYCTHHMNMWSLHCCVDGSNNSIIIIS